MGRHQKRSLFRVPYELISKEIYPKLTYWAINANSFHERMNFSCRYSGRCKNSLLVIARRSFTGQTRVFFFNFLSLWNKHKKRKVKHQINTSVLELYYHPSYMVICFKIYSPILRSQTQLVNGTRPYLLWKCADIGVRGTFGKRIIGLIPLCKKDIRLFQTSSVVSRDTIEL